MTKNVFYFEQSILTKYLKNTEQLTFIILQWQID